MKKEYLSSSPGKTRKIGELMAKEIISAPSSGRAVVVAIAGELGAGKTTFLQGFGRKLGIKEKILSPTFLIFRKFKTRLNGKKEKGRFDFFFHFDCYRAQDEKEILDLNFKEIVLSPRNVIAIEWAEKIKEIIPKDAIWLEFKFVDKNKRKIIRN